MLFASLEFWAWVWNNLGMHSEWLQKTVQTLHSGGLLLHPTETCYGLAVDIFQRSAVEKLYRAKEMPFTKPVSILVRDLEEAQRYGEFSNRAMELAEQHWPGPLTIIVPRKAALPHWINPGHETVGFRVSPQKKTREILEAFGGPLTTTSANKSGQPQAYWVQEALDQGLEPDHVVDGGQLSGALPSTIVEVDGAELKLVREGDLKLVL